MTEPPKRGRPKATDPKRAYQVRFPSSLDDALEEAAERSRRSKNIEIQIAVEEYLTRLGLWPRVGDDPESDPEPKKKRKGG